MKGTRHLRYSLQMAQIRVNASLFELATHSERILKLIPVAPDSASVLVTHNCNSRCITCNMWKSRSTDELITAELEDILGQMRAMGMVGVGFEGGEALLRDDFPEIVERAHELNFESIGMMTNGLLLTRAKAESLIEKGITGIGVSLNGIGETHDFVRGIKGAYQKSMRALEELVNLRDSKYPFLRLHIGTILMQPVMNEIVPLVSLADRLKVDFSLQLLDGSLTFFEGIDTTSLWIEDQEKLDRLLDELDVLRRTSSALKHYPQARLEYARRYFSDPKRADIPCLLGYLTIWIDAYGNVYSGCWPLGTLGNLREKSLREIIKSREYKRRVQSMFRKECPGCSCGYPSNLAYNPGTLANDALRKLKLRH